MAVERTLRTRLFRLVGYLAGLLLALSSVGIFLGWRAFGHRAVEARQQRMKSSRQWHDRHFVNPQPLVNSFWGALAGAWRKSPHVSPALPLPVAATSPQRFAAPPPTGMRVTWLGHSTVLVEMDGHRVLTDPIWSERASPISGIGPRRWFTPPIAIQDLPPIDAVVISHDHYDHLDYATISAMKSWDTRFVVPLGVGAHLEYWGIPAAHITELDWWERTEVGSLAIVCTPARHASGRVLLDDDAKLWAGYALISARHRLYYSGDTGLFPAMREIGSRLGPFDLTMIEVGQYGSAWPDWHIGPEQAVIAHQLVRGRLMLPVHWGTFALAYHAWTEPIERALLAGAAAGIQLVVPRPGQSFEPEAPPAQERWWPEVPWSTAAQAPIVSSQMN
jgi:L-ascorbate metabolism protein UlaG (beta-lactamase superfamily)